MVRYIGKRLLSAIPVLFIVSIVVFMIIHLTPGDPARVMLGDQALEQDVEALREQMGLNEPMITQYINWIKGIFQGDFGTSIFMQGTMLEIIASHIGPTIALTLSALFIAVVLAIPLGIFAAKYRGRIADQLITGFSMLGVSIPNFLLGLLVMLFFGVVLKILPTAGYQSPARGISGFVRYMILPALSLGLMHAALITRMTRSSMLSVLNSDYIKMAKAKGVRETVMLFKHALKNAFLPILTVIGQSLISLLAGAMVTESVFNIPGIGQLVINSIERRDYEVVQAVVLVIALMNVIVMLVLDLLNGVIDPRVRMKNGE